MTEILKVLTETNSTSGREEAVRNKILGFLSPYVDGHRVDRLGNLIVWKKGRSGKKILLDAHMDEIGVVVTHIDDRGFLRIEMVGGMDPRNLLGSRIRFLNEEGTCGVVGVEGETQEELKQNLEKLSFDRIYVDIGAYSKEEAMKRINIGTFGVYDSHFENFGNVCISKAMDDRVGCAVLIKLFESLKETEHSIYGVFSVQEEVGLVGASVAAYEIDPDIAIALDVTGAFDTPKAHKRMGMKLGAGPAMKVMDQASISDRRLLNKLVETAEKHGIPYQMEVLVFGGTDAAGYQKTKSGIPSATVSIPTRYIHTPHEMVDIRDVENTVKLLNHFCQEAFD
ncbi:MAG TPA: aminopeptidase [Thermotogae bacterium]|nr:aminopeptidase [Thermotogota bacterium]